MKLDFDKSFSKALDKIKSPKTLTQISDTLENCEVAKRISQISGIKKLSGFKTFYRIRVGNYRIGIEFIKPDTILFITVLSRKDIYKRFP